MTTVWVRGVSREVLRAAFYEYFGIGFDYADLLVLLYERPLEPIPVRELRRLLSSHRPPNEGTLHERMRVLRQALDLEAVESGGRLEPSGYALTEVGFEECRRAVLCMSEVMWNHAVAQNDELPKIAEAAARKIAKEKARIIARAMAARAQPKRRRQPAWMAA